MSTLHCDVLPSMSFLAMMLCITMVGCDAKSAAHKNALPAQLPATNVPAYSHVRQSSAATINEARHERLSSRAANPELVAEAYERMLASIRGESALDAYDWEEHLQHALRTSNAVWLSEYALKLLDDSSVQLAMLYAAAAIKVASDTDLTLAMGQGFRVVFAAFLDYVKAAPNNSQAEEAENTLALVDSLVAQVEARLGDTLSENVVPCYIQLCTAQNTAILGLKRDIDATLAFLDTVHATMDMHALSEQWKTTMRNYVLYDIAWEATRSADVYHITPAALQRLKQYVQQIDDSVVRPGFEEPLAMGNVIIEEPYLKPLLLKAIEKLGHAAHAR